MVDERTGVAYATVSVPEGVVRGVCGSAGAVVVSGLLLETSTKLHHVLQTKR